jgi:leucyl-tRNA synthetase
LLNEYDPHAIEAKWQAVWEAERTFHVENEPRADDHYYMLEMLPYPSGSLHMGHVLNYTLGDVVTHYRRRTGHHVLRPMGFDSFGLPAENAAIKEGGNPLEITEKSIAAITHQMKRMGWAIDWEREVSAHEPTFYHWTQWLFLKFFEHGLAYRRAAPVNWCPNDQTVLSNEHVVDGRCWRRPGDARLAGAHEEDPAPAHRPLGRRRGAVPGRRAGPRHRRLHDAP